MAIGFKGRGDSIDITLTATAAANVGFIHNDTFGVIKEAGVSGDVRALHLEGEWELDAEAAESWNDGDTLYWNSTNDTITDTVGSNRIIGVASKAKGASEATGWIKLLPLAE